MPESLASTEVIRRLGAEYGLEVEKKRNFLVMELGAWDVGLHSRGASEVRGVVQADECAECAWEAAPGGD